MRKLQTSDVFNAMRIIKAAGAKEEVKRIALIVSSQKKYNIKEIGLEFILGIIEKISGKEVEKEFYIFAADIFEVEASEIEKMDPMDLVDNFMKLSEVIDKDRWSNFFMLLAKLTK